MERSVVIIADGAFPKHDIPLGYLKSKKKIICCDGAVAKLVAAGLEPWAIVGDLDSVPDELAKKFADRMHRFDDQNTNDLTKAVLFSCREGFESIIILGATGLREDHTIGNISLLMDYIEFVDVKMVTDEGIFIPIAGSSKIATWCGQQVSIFSNRSDIEISSRGLKYPLEKAKLINWWIGSLNEAVKDTIEIQFDEGPVLVFLGF
jgi:thiamine pyrophosphokinase